MSPHSVTWERPGPGTWELDASHQSAPYGRYTDELMLEPSERGALEGFRAAGLPLRTVKGGVVNGWWYVKVQPLSGPEEGGAPPPAAVFWLLFKLHPELRRRRKTANRFMAERQWEATLQGWATERPRYVERLRALQATPVNALSDAQLGSQLAQVCSLAKDLMAAHFRAVPACAIPIGDYLVHTQRWANVSAGQAIRAISGFTTATTRPLESLDAIIGALRSEGRLGVLDGRDPKQIVEALGHGDTQSARLYREYAAEFGIRVATGYSVLDETLNELPHLIVGSLRSRAALERPASGYAQPSQARVNAEAAAKDLEARVPEQHRAAWRQMLDGARSCTERREDDGGLLLSVLGLARQLVLEAGGRLVKAGSADEAESACDLTSAELISALKGAGPSAAEIRRHTEQRRAWMKLTPPAHLGPAPQPPPIERFPSDVQRVVAAMFAFVSRFSADADPIAESGPLCGHGVSPGVVRGRARVILGTADFERFQPGEILIARSTSPTYNTLLANASAIVTQSGGLICHAAIVAREFGIPGVVGVRDVVTQISDGAWIEVDGDRGVIQLLGSPPPDSLAPSLADSPAAAALGGSTPSVQEAGDAWEPAPGAPAQVLALGEATDVSRFGGKTTNLAKLLAEGVAVPRGIALDYVATWWVASGHAAAELAELLGQLEALRAPFAVRSSANVEDAESVSFAGQFTTKLGVGSGQALLDAIREVAESAHSEAVQAYRRRLKLSEPIRMSVLVQELVAADTAGVLFFDPEHDRYVVEAAFGLGEAVVGGEVTPDRYELDWAGRLVKLTPGDQTSQLVSDGAGVAYQPLVEARRATRCLTERQLEQLAALGARVTKRLGGTQDIEWAFSAAGELFCLQARPLTRSL